MKNLVELNLAGNNIDGHLPQCLCNLTDLEVLDLSSNQLVGNLPSVVGDLTSLKYLALSDNSFGGLFSFSSLGSNSKLEVFQLSTKNSMLQVKSENWLPTFQLKILYLPNLSSVIPNFLLHQYNLQSIDLSHNKLVGAFPVWLLQNNTNLKALYLTNNSFSRIQLPKSKHDLVYIDVSNNHFRRQFPKNIGIILSSLLFINMSGNSFEGNIPSSVAVIKGLKLLDLSSNDFSGEQPRHVVSSCFELMFLSLSDDNFHGQIFADYMNLTSLEWLYLDKNHFSGNMGDGLLKSTSLRTLDMSKNMISGQIPYWICNLSESRDSYNVS